MAADANFHFSNFDSDRGRLGVGLARLPILIRPPAYSAIGQWAITEQGKLTIFGACTGAIITIGFAAYGAGVAQICRWAFSRFMTGKPSRPEVARPE